MSSRYKISICKLNHLNLLFLSHTGTGLFHGQDLLIRWLVTLLKPDLNPTRAWSSVRFFSSLSLCVTLTSFRASLSKLTISFLGELNLWWKNDGVLVFDPGIWFLLVGFPFRVLIPVVSLFSSSWLTSWKIMSNSAELMEGIPESRTSFSVALGRLTMLFLTLLWQHSPWPPDVKEHTSESILLWLTPTQAEGGTHSPDLPDPVTQIEELATKLSDN